MLLEILLQNRAAFLLSIDNQQAKVGLHLNRQRLLRRRRVDMLTQRRQDDSQIFHDIARSLITIRRADRHHATNDREDLRWKIRLQ